MTVLPKPFLDAMQWLWPIEGGWYDGKDPRDRHPTMYGITQETYAAAGYPGSVRNITKAEAERIYYTRFWVPAACNWYPWPLSLVHFDAAVNHGVGNARKLLARANWDWERYIGVRRDFYAAIIRNNPAMKANERGWENRMRKLETLCRETA